MMHLRSITMKGFKSFPHRTTLEFSPGVGVVVGPNGSGKSNITDAVLWALGEQSPLAVRGQTMKDVIFAGGHGIKGSSAAEVEVVIDNTGSDDRLQSEFSEISIVRRLDRSGDGEYRLNGARCRLADVAEVLSDSGLGKEMHSVVSQGRVEAIVLSRPRERRLLIEEAAGLGKHRRRRRRAQLKLERTGENLSRALDVEREARARLRPLKRQAEAAQLHERLQRQTSEARHVLCGDSVRTVRAELAGAEAAAAAARAERDEAERLLAAVATRREAAEQAFAKVAREREEQQARLFAARSAADRIAMRLERARDHAQASDDARQRGQDQLAGLEAKLARPDDPACAERIAGLEAELEQLEGGREERLRAALAELTRERETAQAARAESELALTAARGVLEQTEREAEGARERRGGAERATEAARTEAARAGAEVAAVNQFLRASAGGEAAAGALSARLEVEPGYELALAAVLGPRLGAALVTDLAAGEQLLDGAGEDGGLALLAGAAAAGADASVGSAAPGPDTAAPAPGAERLLDRVRAEDAAAEVAERLLGSVWVVGSAAEVVAGFEGVAVTRAGRVLDRGTGELRQAPAGGAERMLEERNRRVALVAASAEAMRAEAAARTALEKAGAEVAGADGERERADTARRLAQRELERSVEAERHVEWLIERRREAPDEGPDAVRGAELGAELREQRAALATASREREERTARAGWLRARIDRDEALAAAATRAGEALEAASAAVATRVEALAREGTAGAEVGERTAATLRACAHEEASLQSRLRAGSERVTAAEVGAQQRRDAAAGAEAELAEVAGRLGLDPEPAAEPLEQDTRDELVARIERLGRRREQLGPVNPLAASEYEQAVAHVEEMESRRSDLEGALAELERLIRETDRRIRESFEQTFEAAARNFEEVVEHLFPGGRGRLRLVRPDQVPRPVLGGEAAAREGEDASAAPEQDTEDPDARPDALEPGVEVEVTPAGKSTKRLSLLSGGEKSLVALAFMFAVFLARPCPFYILDEVEAALDDLNIDRFLQLVRRYSDRAQFIVVTHQKRTMDAADRLYGVSMGGDGVSRVVSRRLPAAQPADEAAAAATAQVDVA